MINVFTKNRKEKIKENYVTTDFITRSFPFLGRFLTSIAKTVLGISSD